MASKRKKHVIANWKLYPSKVAVAEKIFSEVKKVAIKISGVETVICPPFVHIDALAALVTGHRCVVGAQDCFNENNGAYTGEISADQLMDVGARYVILGHSERRAMGETDKLINMKVTVALKAGLSVVLCVGEEERDRGGEFLKFVRAQIKSSLSSVPRRYFQNLLVTYEPVWAISSHAQKSGDKEDAEDMQHMGLFVRKVLSDLCGPDIAKNTPVLYGGSVNPRNAEEYLRVGEVDGFLVGRASERAESFNEIIKITSSIK